MPPPQWYSHWSMFAWPASHFPICILAGVVSAPLWNSEKSRFAGMFTVSDIIHLIQYYYKCSSYDAAAADLETFRLESLRGVCFLAFSHAIELTSIQILRSNWASTPLLFFASIRLLPFLTPPNS